MFFQNVLSLSITSQKNANQGNQFFQIQFNITFRLVLNVKIIPRDRKIKN
jgi:hypothetical protein